MRYFSLKLWVGRTRALGIAGSFILVIFALVNAPQGHAQAPAAAPSFAFEVASVRPDHLDGHSTRMSTDADSLVASGLTLKRLIQIAYNLQESQVSGGHGWISSETYAIQAKLDQATFEALKKLPSEQHQEQWRLMEQALLVERFKLKLSHGSKELPIYALVVAGKGPKFSPSTGNSTSSSSSNGQARIKGMSMSRFAEWLSSRVGRKVVDKTGLEGKYDLTFHWGPDWLGSTPVSAADSAPRAATLPPDLGLGPSIFTALQEQLGLKLKSEKSPVEILVIESAERPSAD